MPPESPAQPSGSIGHHVPHINTKTRRVGTQFAHNQPWCVYCCFHRPMSLRLVARIVEGCKLLLSGHKPRTSSSRVSGARRRTVLLTTGWRQPARERTPGNYKYFSLLFVGEARVLGTYTCPQRAWFFQRQTLIREDRTSHLREATLQSSSPTLQNTPS